MKPAMTDEALSLTIEQSPEPADVQTVIRNLVAYNTSRAEPEGHQPLAVFVRDGSGAVLGGAFGYTHWGWLFVSHLWVGEDLRGQGWGSRLMASLEAAAVLRGCHSAHLDTFSFQALGFYERLGYQRFGTLPDYPVGHSRYFLWRRLVPPGSR